MCRVMCACRLEESPFERGDIFSTKRTLRTQIQVVYVSRSQVSLAAGLARSEMRCVYLVAAFDRAPQVFSLQ